MRKRASIEFFGGALLALALGCGVASLRAAEANVAPNPADLVVKLPPFDVYASPDTGPIWELGDVKVPPRLAGMSSPKFPPSARYAQLGARVNVTWVVTKSGAIVDVHAVDVTLVDYFAVAPEELKNSEIRRQEIAKAFGDAAVAAIKTWKVGQPAMINQAGSGKLVPVAVRMNLPITMHLLDAQKAAAEAAAKNKSSGGKAPNSKATGSK